MAVILMGFISLPSNREALGIIELNASVDTISA
jgi:hypothetical protein